MISKQKPDLDPRARFQLTSSGLQLMEGSAFLYYAPSNGDDF
jgi:hypothetical protein